MTILIRETPSGIQKFLETRNQRVTVSIDYEKDLLIVTKKLQKTDSFEEIFKNIVSSFPQIDFPLRRHLEIFDNYLIQFVFEQPKNCDFVRTFDSIESSVPTDGYWGKSKSCEKKYYWEQYYEGSPEYDPETDLFSMRFHVFCNTKQHLI